MKPRKVLSDNLIALMGARPELDTLKKITAASGGKLSNGKLGRIRAASHTTDIDTLGELADVFGLTTWQLMVPGLNPKALPVLAGSELLGQIRALVTAESRKADDGQLPDLSSQAATGEPQTATTNTPDRKHSVVLPGEAVRDSNAGRKKSVSVQKQRGGRGSKRAA